MALFQPYQRPGEKTQPSGAGSTAAKRTGMFSRKKADATPAEPVTQPVAPAEAQGKRQPVKKDAPTISRKEAERQRMERLHPSLTPKQEKQLERQRAMQQRAEGYERQEMEPRRVLLRNFVDSRFHITQLILPLMLILLVSVFFYQYVPALVEWATYGVWLLMLVCLVDILLTWNSFKKLLRERLPQASPKGLAMYLTNRMMQIPRFRTPAPVVKRGDVI